MSELTHWGILGMKWGIRRYQNPDGTLTEAGKRRYRKNNFKQIAKSAIRDSKDLENWSIIKNRWNDVSTPTDVSYNTRKSVKKNSRR